MTEEGNGPHPSNFVRQIIIWNLPKKSILIYKISYSCFYEDFLLIIFGGETITGKYGMKNSGIKKDRTDWLNNMTSEEKIVLKIAEIYEQEYRKIFKDVLDGTSLRRNSLPLRSHPRKSSLFRYCWKLRRETRGLLEESEYKNYIHANFVIIKLHKGSVEPTSITGDKAWIRYKVWKRHFDQKLADIGAIPPQPNLKTTDPKIIQELDRNRKFLFEKCEGEPTFEKILDFITKGLFKIWVATEKICPIYLTLSPFIERSNSKDELYKFCNSGESLIKGMVNSEIVNYFHQEYHYEFA